MFSRKAAGRAAPPSQQGSQSMSDMNNLFIQQLVPKGFMNKLNYKKLVNNRETNKHIDPKRY